ncbi:MAG: hypothetical protein JRN06_06750 [Nitrososphaerota archaeon]|nr:hypothetical protein [Nitrososphaerota archaeon]MDG7024522.1 hypothetical protein [Nitrososphaerota archaeon]
MASVKGYIETVLATALLLFVFSFWAEDGLSVLQNATISLIGSLFVGSIVYGLSLLYKGVGLRVGARGALIYFALMLVLLLVRFLLFGPP